MKIIEETTSTIAAVIMLVLLLALAFVPFLALAEVKYSSASNVGDDGRWRYRHKRTWLLFIAVGALVPGALFGAGICETFGCDESNEWVGFLAGYVVAILIGLGWLENDRVKAVKIGFCPATEEDSRILYRL